MKILVIGSGGREHCIIKKLKENPVVEQVYALPGNGGMAEAICVPLNPMDLEAVTSFALAHSIDFCVVTPDDPLSIGLVDALEGHEIPCFGPQQKAAQLESSKLFAKQLMQTYGIPTAAWRAFDRLDEALHYVNTHPLPLVLKADGLAKGKGVVVATTLKMAEEALVQMMQERIFGESGSTVIIEECMQGPEVSVMALTDGQILRTFPSAMDHKRALDGDQGPNTGGMGVICPNPFYTSDIAKRCMDEIFLPTLDALKKEGIVFRGCLYFGLMLTKDGPKLLEYNARFGDPETQAVLSLMQSDLLDALMAVQKGQLADCPFHFSNQHACCIVAASGGYPGAFQKGKVITLQATPDARIDMAGVKAADGQLLTDAGRVLCLTCKGDTALQAAEKAYQAIHSVHFDGMYYRRDIGLKARS